MFTQISLNNFKAYRSAKEVPLRPLTVLVGANNSGKSSLLQAILVLAQTLDDSASRQPLVTSGSYVDLGGYFDIVWGGGGQHRGGNSFRIALNLDDRGWERRFGFGSESEPEAPRSLDVTFAFDTHRNAIVVSKVAITGESKTFSSARRVGRTGYAISHLSKRKSEDLTVSFRHFLPLLLPSAESGQRGRTREGAMDQWFAADEAWNAWATEFGRVAHVAPLRQPIPRFGILGKSLNSELGPGGENLLRVLRAGDDDSRAGERLATEVGRWISEDFKMLQGLELVEVDEGGTILALLGNERGGFERINLANMGEGLSQLLPIVTRVLTTPDFGSLLIEQPELHLHPAAQADLADLFIAGTARGRRQMIIETHSEHMLLRLRRRIAERKVDPSMVAILYVERRGSRSSVRCLDLDESGSFDDWPRGFFDERYREALAIAEAGINGQGDE